MRTIYNILYNKFSGFIKSKDELEPNLVNNDWLPINVLFGGESNDTFIFCASLKRNVYISSKIYYTFIINDRIYFLREFDSKYGLDLPSFKVLKNELRNKLPEQIYKQAAGEIDYLPNKEYIFSSIDDLHAIVINESVKDDVDHYQLIMSTKNLEKQVSNNAETLQIHHLYGKKINYHGREVLVLPINTLNCCIVYDKQHIGCSIESIIDAYAPPKDKYFLEVKDILSPNEIKSSNFRWIEIKNLLAEAKKQINCDELQDSNQDCEMKNLSSNSKHEEKQTISHLSGEELSIDGVKIIVLPMTKDYGYTNLVYTPNRIWYSLDSLSLNKEDIRKKVKNLPGIAIDSNHFIWWPTQDIINAYEEKLKSKQMKLHHSDKQNQQKEPQSVVTKAVYEVAAKKCLATTANIAAKLASGLTSDQDTNSLVGEMIKSDLGQGVLGYPASTVIPHVLPLPKAKKEKLKEAMQVQSLAKLGEGIFKPLGEWLLNELKSHGLLKEERKRIAIENSDVENMDLEEISDINEKMRK